ncbi:MAG TPA: SDR family oxidoreductase [Novosphingobium sp.]
MGSRVAGKVAIVTGAGTSAHSETSVGIGRAISIVLAREGASVLLVDKSRANAEDTLCAIEAEGGKAAVFVGDITSEASCEAMVASAQETFGGLDILVNNAAISRHKPITETSTELYEEIMGLNVGGTFKACKFAIPALIARGGGAIVNIGSVASIRDSGSAHPAYTASKGALLGMMVDLAGEYGQYGIRVNSVLPGMTASPMQETIGNFPEELKTRINMMRRLGSGWDIANAVLFLASDEAAYITGVTLPVDGGATMGMISSAGRYSKQT